MTTKLLSELSTNISSGLTPLRSNAEFWEKGTVPWLKTEQLGEKYIYETNEHISEAALKKTSIKLFPENSLSIAMYGEGKTRGNLSILKKAMATNQACCNVSIDPDKADFEYVYYFLKTQYDELRNLSSGVRKNLNSNDIKNYPIRLPENLVSQKKIANVLKALDKKIELNNRINAELEAMAKTLYDYWFVQFDFPDGNAIPYKSSGGKMVYNPILKREIPEGWSNGNLGEIAELYQPKTISEKEMIEDGQYLVYGANGIVGRYDEYNNEKSVVAVTCRGNSCGVINVTRPYSWITGNAMVVKTGSHFLPPTYIYNLLRSSGLENVITGSAQPQITRTNLAPMKIIMPDENVLTNYAEFVKPNFEKRMAILDENEKLARLRDWLLPMLMNGQVTVGEVS
jgi:type I restriction enzyme S subunit